MFGLPLLQHFVSPFTEPSGAEAWPDFLVIAGLVAFGLWFLLTNLSGRAGGRSRRGKRRPRRPRRQRPGGGRQGSRASATVLVDGSNVIFWRDNTPQLDPLLQVVRDLSRRGLTPGVVFDANVGYRLTGKFLGEGDLSRMLSLPRDQILVVPKGKQADPFLLETARDLKVPIVTNDRFRDWAEKHPEVREPGLLIRGGMREGQVWLQELAAKEAAP